MPYRVALDGTDWDMEATANRDLAHEWAERYSRNDDRTWVVKWAGTVVAAYRGGRLVWRKG